MSRKRLFLALSALMLSACGTKPVTVPYTPIKPPAQLTEKCPEPPELKEELTDAATIYKQGRLWMMFGSCEMTKRQGLIQAWPK